MVDRHTQLLLTTPHVRVTQVVCAEDHSGPGPAEWVPAAEIILPRRGVFCIHHRDQQLVADATTAVLFGADSEYRVSHPVDGGDICTALVFPPDMLEDALGSAPSWRAAILRPASQLAAWGLVRAVRHSVVEQLGAEENALWLLGTIARDFVSSDRDRDQAPLPRRLLRPVIDARLLLASAPTHHWQLAEIARVVDYSPFHLARVFRAGTGTSLHRHLVRLRLALALDRLAQGEPNLGALAIELGFAHHSHFTASFRSIFGITPAALRDYLTHAQLANLRTILTANERTPCL